MIQAAAIWNNICNDPFLRDIPYKIQTDKWGNILMSPATNEHGIYQAKIISLLSNLINQGIIISECSIQTIQGVKVADAAWASEEFMKKNKGRTPFEQAPEICVEILSPSNSEDEMNEKKELYFSRGAKEFWLCDLNGNIKKYNEMGKINRSGIIENFPDYIGIYS